MATVAEDRVRRQLGERIPDGKADTDTFFSDDEITQYLVESNGDINLATLFGWRDKSARYAKMIDAEESGSVRRLSQLYRQAREMYDLYRQLVNSDTTRRTAVAGRSASPWGKQGRLPAVMFTQMANRMSIVGPVDVIDPDLEDDSSG